MGCNLRSLASLTQTCPVNILWQWPMSTGWSRREVPWSERPFLICWSSDRPLYVGHGSRNDIPLQESQHFWGCHSFTGNKCHVLFWSNYFEEIWWEKMSKLWPLQIYSFLKILCRVVPSWELFSLESTQLKATKSSPRTKGGDTAL